MMSDQLVLLIILLTLLRAAIARIDGYHAFIQGAQTGIRTAVSILPVMFSVMFILRLLMASGLSEAIAAWVAPAFNLLHIPTEAAPLLLLKPLSGSGSMAALEQLYVSTGVDSSASRLASILMGSSETVFYTTAVYLSAANVKRLPYVIPVSLVAMLLGAIFAGLCFG